MAAAEQQHQPNNKEPAFSPEVVGSGSLAEFLRTQYLVEPALEKPIIIMVPSILEEILAPVLTDEYLNRDSYGHLRAVVTGSVPRFISSYIDEEVGVDPRFWQYASFFGQEALDETDEQARELLSYLAHGPADIDFKIDPQERVYGQFGWQLIDRCQINRSDVNKRQVATREDGEPVYRFFTNVFRFSSLYLEINFGPIPTNPDREGIEIKFFDPEDTEEPIFLAHIGYLPIEALDSIKDKRLGETFDKQDYGTARLESDGRTLSYHITNYVLEIMRQPDSLVSHDILRTRSIEDLVELGLRSLRVNLLHPFPVDEETIDSSWFSPLIVSGSLFDFRRAVQELSINGQVLEDRIKALIIREFFLCLTVNPYLTIQFLKDSGVALLIPGLRHINMSDWDRVLHSVELRLTLEDGIRSAKPGEGYLREQISAYQEREELKGADKFIRALETLGFIGQRHPGESCWSRILNLFKEKEIELDGDIEEKSDILYEKGEVEGFSFNGDQQLGLGEGYSLIGSFWYGDNQVHLVSTREIEGEEREEFLKKARTAFSEVSGLVTGIPGFEPNRGFIKQIIEAMLLYPTGLTARELAELSIGSGDDFTQQFLLLKLAGLVRKRLMWRRNIRGEKVEVNFYSFGSADELVDIRQAIVEDDDCLWSYENVLYEENPLPNDELRRKAVRYVNAFGRAGIDSIQALQALTIEDIALMGGIKNIHRKDYNICLLRIRQILRAYSLVQEDRR